MEVQARKDFNSHFSKHFLHALFPGMDDLPPPFATRNPKSFDDNLPLLSAEDLEVLRKALPEMSELLQTPDPVQLPTVVLQSSVAMQSCGDDTLQSEVKASSSFSPRHASCQELPPEEAKYQTEELMKSTSSEKDCHDGACPEDRELTPKLVVSDDEFEEVADEPSPGLKADAADLLGMPVPQEAILCSPDSLGHTSNDFQTADFYIDESMPSSISDSNGIVPVAPSPVPPSSAAPAQQAHVAAELQRQLDERNTALLAVQEELERERIKRQELRCAVTNVCEAAAAVCADSRSTAASIRDDLAAALQMVSNDASAIGAAMDTALQALLDKLENDKAASIATEVDRVRREFESAEEDHRHQLEVERQKFEDAQREVHMYQQQLQQLMQVADSLRTDSALALASLKNTMQQEHESAIAKATLEHELEQEALNERLRAFERSHEEEVQDLNEVICEKDRQIQMLFQDRQVLEEQLHTRFSLEKEELLAQCRQECAQREQAIREELIALHEERLDQIQHCHEEAIQKAKEQTRLELQQEWESRMPGFKMAMSDNFGTQLQPSPIDKVSILSCQPGDVVLLCYDEGHQNYVLFVLGPNLHFLHTDCLDTLGLKTVSLSRHSSLPPPPPPPLRRGPCLRHPDRQRAPPPEESPMSSPSIPKLSELLKRCTSWTSMCLRQKLGWITATDESCFRTSAEPYSVQLMNFKKKSHVDTSLIVWQVKKIAVNLVNGAPVSVVSVCCDSPRTSDTRRCRCGCSNVLKIAHYSEWKGICGSSPELFDFGPRVRFERESAASVAALHGECRVRCLAVRHRRGRHVGLRASAEATAFPRGSSAKLHQLQPRQGVQYHPGRRRPGFAAHFRTGKMQNAAGRARSNASTRTPGATPERLDGASSTTMEVVSVEGEDMQPEDFTNDAGWCEVRRRNITKTSGGISGPKRTMLRDAAALTGAPGDSKWKGERTIRQIANASRLPRLPAEDYKVIVRPRGGLSVSEHRQARIYCCLRNAAGVGREAAEEDSICINYKQNIVVVSTPSEERARRYGAITKIRVGEQEHEASAYRAAPENTSKGLIRGISQEESSEDIIDNLVTARNPSILHAKRMGNTDNVIVLFEDYTCRDT
ncbi:hypothetical protein HPB51_012748 [Rhipicephalus microplus]|uniref:Uncharacterized protein n=1 Tax=Rhipicephalus microplus TaxID=6941 RepID=A0A9J6E9T7_RHIMP|nr:hypothetical protein HPB51_012748 [Rhipicephalus microplus]